MLGGAVTGKPCPSTSPSSMKPSGPCCPSSGSTSESFGNLIFFIEPFLPVCDGLMCPPPLYALMREPRERRLTESLSAIRHQSRCRLARVGPRQRLDARTWCPQLAQRLLVRAGETRQVGGFGPHQP